LRLALAVLFLRGFYELATPTTDALFSLAIGVALGSSGMLGILRLLRE
jgi:hypothetical protein